MTAIDFLDPAPGEPDEPTHPRQCTACGRLPLHEDPRAASLLLEQIRQRNQDRLSRTEELLVGLGDADRVAVARWLQGALDRPPLVNNRSRSFAPVVAALDALWRDIYYLTSDPLSPVVSDGPRRWTVPLPHHELVDMREGEFVEP